MTIFNKTLYHGTDQELTVLKPMGINMGTRWQDPHWAIYFWDDFELAKRWAVYQYCRRQLKVSLIYHIPTGGFLVNPHVLKDVLRQAVGKTAYVYQVDVSRLEVGLGSSPHIREFTVGKEMTPDTTHPIVMTKQLLTDVAIEADRETVVAYINDIDSGKYDNNRGILYKWLLDPKKDGERHKYHRKIKDGTLQPGDPLTDVSLEQWGLTLPPSAHW